MNTISTTASTKTILAIDLGKYKSVVCLLDPDTGEYRFTTFETTRSAVRQLLDKERPAVVIIEACLLEAKLPGPSAMTLKFGKPGWRPRLASAVCSAMTIRSAQFSAVLRMR